MEDLFGFLILVSLIALAVGLFKPSVFSRVIKNPSRKKVGLILGGLLFLFFVGFGMTTDTKTATNTPTNTEATTQTAPTNKPEESAKPTDAPKPVEKFNVGVTSQIVKKVDGKYRYFFDIRNNDTKDFQGSVSITLYNNKQSTPLGQDGFDTSKPIEPGLGASVYIDINTGPTSEHGEYGITKYKYVVKVDGKEVNSGEELISNKLENLDF